MEALRAEAILSLPMRDGLIVPASAEERACGLIREAGERVAGIALQLKVDRAPVGSGEVIRAEPHREGVRDHSQRAERAPRLAPAASPELPKATPKVADPFECLDLAADFLD